jgi:outer membrane protein OmpA-like peptidoglycan-associated protein
MFQLKYKQIITTIFIIAGMVTLHAQTSNPTLNVAEKLYKQGDYYSASFYYKDFLSGKGKIKSINGFTGYLSKSNTSIKKDSTTNLKTLATMHLSDCYRLLNDYANAENWYDSAANTKGANQYSAIQFWHAVCLRNNGKTAAAKNEFITYCKIKIQQPFYVAAQKELADIEFAEKNMSLKIRRKTNVQRLKEPVNGNESNYAPQMVNQQLFFSSTRIDTNVALKQNPFQHHIYASLNNLVNKLNFEQENSIEQGAASFSADGLTVYLTQWETVNNKKTGAIYISTKSGSSWAKPLKLDSTINVTGYTSQQPFISIDGKYLFFSSNRPGGQGNFDIWCAEITAPSTIKNVFALDASINTSQNEKAPYFNLNNQTLVFSSDGLTGMGGYDLYYSKKNDTKFSTPINFRTPVNSVKDDIYFYANESAKDLIENALISSDRVSNCCLELFNIQHLPAPVNHITGFVKDVTTLIPLSNISFQWENQQKILSVNTNEKGEFDVLVPDSSLFNVKIKKENYFDTTSLVEHIFWDLTDTVYKKDFYLRPIPLQSIIKDFIIYFDFNKFDLLNDSKPILDSIAKQLTAQPKWKLSIEGHADGIGTDNYNLGLSQKRSESCLAYLKQLQIDTLRLVPSYYGKNVPVAPNKNPNGTDNPEGRKYNRRVKLSILVAE